MFHKSLELHSTISEKKIFVTNFPICNHLCFCNHLDKLETVLFEVKLITNNAPLTYAYPNTIEICLTPNNLLFGKQLLYSSNTTSTALRNLTVLSSAIDKINCINNHFFG